MKSDLTHVAWDHSEYIGSGSKAFETARETTDPTTSGAKLRIAVVAGCALFWAGVAVFLLA